MTIGSQNEGILSAQEFQNSKQDKDFINTIENKLYFKNLSISLPTRIDITEWCSPVKNQLNLRACTAIAATSLIEYFEKKLYGKIIDFSSLFVYKTARNLLQLKGDTGAYPRNVMHSLSIFGVLFEKHWPYTFDGITVNTNWDIEPVAHLFSLASNNKAFEYFCHCPHGEYETLSDILLSVKKFLVIGIPSMFAYWGFPSNQFSDISGGIAYPSNKEFAVYSHALSVFGYDDNIKICNTLYNIQTKGALLIKNSKGLNWGANGYGWLPYDYILNKLSYDFWSLLPIELVHKGQFDI